MGSIFISYSHKDYLLVEPYVNYLKEKRYLYFYDKKDLKSGDFWDAHIRCAIASCTIFIAFVSNNYRYSEYCQKEYDDATDRKKKIYVIDLDKLTHNLSLANKFSKIQVAMNYDEFIEIVTSHDDFPSCKLTTFYDVNENNGIPFLNYIGKGSLVPSYENFLSLFINLLSYLLAKQDQNEYLSSKADFSTLFIDPRTKSFAFINDEPFSNNLNLYANSIFIKNILNDLMGYRTDSYLLSLPSSLNVNSVLKDHLLTHYKTKDNQEFINQTVIYINEKLNDIYNNSSDINKIYYETYDLINGFKYFLNILIKSINQNNYYLYQVTSSCLMINHIYFKSFFFKKEIMTSSLPDLKDDKDQVYLSDENSSSLEKLINHNFPINIFGSEGSGTSYLLINYYLNNQYSLYIDLSKIASLSSSEENLIQNAFSLNFPNTIGFNFDDLATYSSYHQKICLLLDNFDYVANNLKQIILNEIDDLKSSFDIVFFSRKRYVNKSLALDISKKMEETYAEIISLNKNKILAYLKFCKVSPNIINQIDNLADDDRFFKFFSSYSKINLLIKLLNNNESFLKEILVQNELEIFSLLLESGGEISLINQISSLFNNKYLDISSLIKKELLEEFKTLGKCAYKSEYGQISKLLFKDLLVTYGVLQNDGDEYYIVDAIKTYLLYRYVKEEISIIIKKDIHWIDKLKELDDFSSNILEKYSLLKLLSKDDLFFDLINGNRQSFDKNLINQNTYPNLTLLIYKLSLYREEEIQNEILTNLQLYYIPEMAFASCENIEIIKIPASCEYISHASFSKMTRLKKAYLISSTFELKISAFCFISCPNLETIYIGNNYKVFNHPLFRFCNELKEIKIAKNNENFVSLLNNQLLCSKGPNNKLILNIGVPALKGRVILPKEIKEIKDHSLAYNQNIEELILPDEIEDISSDFTDFCPRLTKYSIENNSKYFTKDGILYSKDSSSITLFRMPPGIKGDIVIDPMVSIIGGDSLSTCQFINNVKLNSSIKEIGSYAFADMESIQTIDFGELDLTKITYKNYLFLSSYPGLTIKYIDQFDDIKLLTINDFHTKFNKQNVKSLSFEFKNKTKIDLSLIEKSSDFTILKKVDDDALYKKINLFRNNKEILSQVRIEKDDYNICLIGLDEYNKLNNFQDDELKKYISNLIDNTHVKMFAILRDLPKINELFNHEVTIIRSPDGFISGSKKLLKIYEDAYNDNKKM